MLLVQFLFFRCFFFKNIVSRYSYYNQFTYNTSINNWIQLQVIKISFALSLCSENAMAQQPIASPQDVLWGSFVTHSFLPPKDVCGEAKQPRYFNPDKIPAIKSVLICHKERGIEILFECLHAITDFFTDSALARIRTKISDACDVKKPKLARLEEAFGKIRASCEGKCFQSEIAYMNN